MNDTLTKQLQDQFQFLELDLTRLLPGVLAVAGLLLALIVVRKLFRVMLRVGRKRASASDGWTGCDPELDQLFQLTAASGQLVQADADSEPRGCYVLRLRGRQRERALALMSAIHDSRSGWRYQPGDGGGQSVLTGSLFSIKV